MPKLGDHLAEARSLIQKRIGELVEERKRLENALAELGGKKAPSRRRPGRPSKSSSRSSSSKRGRGKGTRADQAASLIEKTPGIEASDLAKAMRVKPNNLYGVLGGLAKAGRVRKEGRRYFPAS